MARRKAKEATEIYLERVALWYLERYPGSVARVTQALQKRVRRSVKELETDPEEGARNVATVIAKLKAANLLNDARFAAARVRTLRRRGNSARAIQNALYRQGISRDLIDETLANAADKDDRQTELHAAREWVRRKRLGPYHRDPEKQAELRSKDLGKLARAGFSYDICKRVLDEPATERRR